MEIVDGIAEAKRREGAPVSDPARERMTLARVAGNVGPGLENGARLLFTTMFGIAKARQRAVVHGEAPLVKAIRKAVAESAPFPSGGIVACPGAEGSYAQQAVSAMFKTPTILFFGNFEKVFEAVEKGLCPYGILPIENSAAGSVSQVYDLMVKHRFHIVRSVRVKIDHVLLGCRGATLDGVREVSSHPHALAQCGTFLKAHPKIKATPGVNTAVAAKELAASGRRDQAVIASRTCAELYGLDVVAEGIADAAFNYTRFICISKNLEIYPDAGKFSIMLSLPHRPGALNGLISKFAAIDVNLTKLESRPIPGMDFEFRFTFDFEAPPTDTAVLALLSELSQDPGIEHFTFLGAYAER
jgi:chorismate mutase/prephenate dehydratase